MLHPLHTFCFAELHTRDVERAAQFYGDLFGWTAVPVAGVEGYFVFKLNGYDVVGLRRTDGGSRWMPFVAVANADETGLRASELGARVVTPAFDMRGMARSSVLEDPDGGAFGLWEARGHAGADVQDETGTMWWVELLARDVERSRAFYTALFGWRFDETLKYGPLYTVFRNDESGVAGAVQYEPDWGVRQRWQVLFAIDDWKQTITHAARIGGRLGFWRDVPHTGRLGYIDDPASAPFLVMHPQRPDLRA